MTCLGFDKSYHRGSILDYKGYDIMSVIKVDGKRFGCHTPGRYRTLWYARTPMGTAMNSMLYNLVHLVGRLLLRVRGVRDSSVTVFTFGIYVETAGMFLLGETHMGRVPCYIVRCMLPFIMCSTSI